LIGRPRLARSSLSLPTIEPLGVTLLGLVHHRSDGFVFRLSGLLIRERNKVGGEGLFEERDQGRLAGTRTHVMGQALGRTDQLVELGRRFLFLGAGSLFRVHLLTRTADSLATLFVIRPGCCNGIGAPTIVDAENI
jgi:hypothetical protein